MRRARILVALLLVLPASAPLAAQSWSGPESLALQVKSKQAGDVAEALVILRYQLVEPPAGPRPVRTDADGRAVVSGLAPGIWEVEVSHPDYLSFVALVVIEGGRKPRIQASFLQASGSSLTPIRVRFADGTGKPASPPVPLPPEAAERLARRRPPAVAAPATESRPPDRPAPPPPSVTPPQELRPLPESARAPETEAAPAEPPAPAEPAPEPPAAPDPAARERPAPAPAAPEPAPEPPASELAEPEPEPEPAMPAPAPEPQGAGRADPMPAEPAEPVSPPPAPPAPAPPAPEPPPTASPDPESPAPESPAPVPPPAPEAVPEAPAVPSPEPPAEPDLSPGEEPAEPAAPDLPAAAEPAPALPEPPEPVPPAAVQPAAVQPAPGPLGATLRAYRDQSCIECRPGEWALSVEVVAGPGSEGCPATAEADGRRLAELLGGSVALELAEVAAPGAAAVSYLEGEASGEAAALLGGPERSCRILAVVLPKGGRFRGARLEAADASGVGDCQASAPCPVGQARWLGQPRVAREPSATVIWGLFANLAPDRARRARLTVYFASPSRLWEPPGS